MHEMLFRDTGKQVAGFGMHAAQQLSIETTFCGISNETDWRRQECVKDLFDGRPVLSGLTLVFVEQTQPFTIQRFQTPD